MNVLLLMAGSDKAFQESGSTFPKNLVEIAGVPMAQRVIENVQPLLKGKSKLLALIKKEENARSFTGTAVRLLVPNTTIIEVPSETAGAACTALLAVEHINNDEPLVITNGDILLKTSLPNVVAGFQKKKLDGGIVVFEAVHPRWSYVKVDKAGIVVEAAEKKPISKYATVGLYYFARGKDFVRAAKNMIKKDDQVDGKFFICPAYNQMVLEQARIGIHKIKRSDYVSLATPRDVENFEEDLRSLRMKHHRLDKMTRGWFVGDFAPTALRSKEAEVAIKTYKAGDSEEAHHHKKAVELTAVVSGEIEMNGKRFVAGDIVTMEPGESCSFRSITDSVNVVVKMPSVAGDKFPG